MIGKPNVYIYKAKSLHKSIIVTEECLELQKYIREHPYRVGLKIIEREDPIKFYLLGGIVVMNCHLRLSSIPADIKKLNNYRGKHPIVLVASDFFLSTNAFEALRGFKVIDISVGEEFNG